MFQTTFLRTLFVILFFWQIISTDSVIRRQIFHNEEIVTVFDLQESGKVIGTDNLRELIGDKPDLVYTALSCKYSDAIVELLQTFFEINEYGLNAPTDIQVPSIKDVTKIWLTSSIDHLQSINPPIVKMINDLFSNLNLYAVLRTSDQSLLKSLLSMNLFLYCIANDRDCLFHYKATDEQESVHNILNDYDFEEFIKNVRKLNTSITQMIGLIERFRNKRCVVSYPYRRNYVVQQIIHSATSHLILDVNNLKQLLNEPLTNLHLLVNDKSDDYSYFDSDIYNPKYLLFESFLDSHHAYLNEVQSQLYRSDSDLLSKYFEVKRTFSIEKYLEFQYSLIGVIADVFYGQIHNVVAKRNGNGDDLNILIELDGNFDYFISRFLPISCSVNVCNKILKARYFLKQTLQKNDILKLSEIFALLNDKFQPTEEKKSIYQIIQKEFNDDRNLSSLIYSLSKNKIRMKTFSTVFNLLTYESHANRDFFIVKKCDFTDITQSESSDTHFVNRMIELQCALFTFRTILKPEYSHNISKSNLYYFNFDLNDFFNIEFTSPKNVLGDKEDRSRPIQKNIAFHKYKTYFANMLNVIAKLYDIYYSIPDVRNILLPLLVRLRLADKNDGQNVEFDFQVMFQTLFVTITLVENYLIKNNLFPIYSVFIYSQLMVYDESNLNSSHFYKQMHNYFESDVKDTPFSNSVERVRMLFYGPTYKKFFQENNTEIKYYWNGRDYTCYQILKNIQIGVIDINDIISFQWFGLKWLVGKILLSVRNALSLLLNKIKSQVRFEINTITSKLKYELLRFELPTTFHTFLGNIVDATVKTLNLNQPIFDSDVNDEWTQLYSDCFETLGVKLDAENKKHFSKISEIFKVFHSDIKNLESFLIIPFLRSENIYSLSEFYPSPISSSISTGSHRTFHKN